VYPLEGLRDAASTLPRGHFEVLETAHFSVMDAPAQAPALIDGFLAGLMMARSGMQSARQSGASSNRRGAGRGRACLFLFDPRLGPFA
jgi:hypothetical protein